MRKIFIGVSNTANKELVNKTINHLVKSYTNYKFLLWDPDCTPAQNLNVFQGCSYFIYLHDNEYVGKGIYNMLLQADKMSIEAYCISIYEEMNFEGLHVLEVAYIEEHNVNNWKTEYGLVNFRNYDEIDLANFIGPPSNSDYYYGTIPTMEELRGKPLFPDKQLSLMLVVAGKRK